MVHACAEGFHFLLVFLGNFLIILSNSFPASVCVCLFVCLSSALLEFPAFRLGSFAATLFHFAFQKAGPPVRKCFCWSEHVCISP